jgi:hypothetical protein
LADKIIHEVDRIRVLDHPSPREQSLDILESLAGELAAAAQREAPTQKTDAQWLREYAAVVLQTGMSGVGAYQQARDAIEAINDYERHADDE